MKILGVDGCPYGWIGIRVDKSNNWHYFLEKSLQNLILISEADICFIDIPISLSIDQAVRVCDVQLRSLLPKKYKSSVFNAPIKGVLKAKSYKEACGISQKITGKKISIQSWNLVSKINEVDTLINKDDGLASLFKESHPESFFFRLNNSCPLSFNKRTKAGREERLELLNRLYEGSFEIYERVIEETYRRDVKYDDVLDAMVLSLFGAIVYPDDIQMLPDNPIVDKNGSLQNVFIPKRKSYLN